MSRERPQPAPKDAEPAQGFGFTEAETLHSRVSDARFQAILDDPKTTVHRIDESYNNYGEFLFVTLSCPLEDGKRECVTMYGIGYHEHRERWITTHWDWYRANQFPDLMAQNISKAEARRLVEQRRRWITPYAQNPEPQSKRGQFYEMLADLTDEDGALSELDDMGDVVPWLLDDFDA